MKAPIGLFVYNRLNNLIQSLKALQNNYLASESDLFIFSDGPKNEMDKVKVEAVRNYIDSISGFKSVKIIKSNLNNGLASSIINGATQILKEYESVIILEDDLITARNFLSFMNDALEFYKNDNRIQSINGYSLYLKNQNFGVYFHKRACSWGWGTWRDRWDPNIFDKIYLKSIIQANPIIIKEFKTSCGADVPKMLMNSINNKNDSWYIRWAFDHFRKNHFSVYPAQSFIKNMGHNEDATHCKGIDSYTSIPIKDENIIRFELSSFQSPNDQINKEFLYYFSLKHKIIIRLNLIKTKSGRRELLREFQVRIIKKL